MDQLLATSLRQLESHEQKRAEEASAANKLDTDQAIRFLYMVVMPYLDSLERLRQCMNSPETVSLWSADGSRLGTNLNQKAKSEQVYEIQFQPLVPYATSWRTWSDMFAGFWALPAAALPFTKPSSIRHQNDADSSSALFASVVRAVSLSPQSQLVFPCRSLELAGWSVRFALSRNDTLLISYIRNPSTVPEVIGEVAAVPEPATLQSVFDGFKCMFPARQK